MQKRKLDAGGQVGAEIKITPEMIEAGVGAWSGYDERFESAYEMIARVYRAMALRAKGGVCAAGEGCAG